MNKFVPFFNNVINMKNANKVSNKKKYIGNNSRGKRAIKLQPPKKKKKTALVHPKISLLQYN